MKRIEEFMEGIERYYFDFGECSYHLGYAQVDTSDDAPYFGIWTNPTSLTTVKYIEGDVYRDIAESVEEYVEYIRQMKTNFENGGREFKGIDPMLDAGISNRFKEIGLGELIH